MPGMNPSIVKKPLQPVSAPQSQPSREDTQAFLESIAQYSKYGSALKRDKSLQEIGAALSQIAEMAETAVTNEAGDWYDAHTLKRNMKEIKGYSSEFMKLATEADTIHQRMTALYDDMGRVLDRYFEIDDHDLTDPKQAAAQSPEMKAAEKKAEPTQTQMVGDLPQKEDENDQGIHPDPSGDPQPLFDTPSPVNAEGNDMTARAIKRFYKKLIAKDPALAERFKKLPAKKMAQAAWMAID